MSAKTRVLLGAFSVCSVCVVHGATVVHDAARDLVLNSRNANVYTNFYGGVWSYMRSSSYNGARTLLPGVRIYTDTEKDASGSNYSGASNLPVIWQRGPALNENASPVISVNPTAWPDAKQFLHGNGWPAIPPGGLSCHPGRVSGAGFEEGNQCVVLRFTVPRDGTYAVTARVWNQDYGKTAVTLLVNGEVRSARRAWESTAANVTTNDFSLAAATYAADDVIELAVDGDGTYEANATGLDFRIAEEVEAATEASTGFLANLAAEVPVNPYTDSFGTWSGYYADAAAPTNAPRYNLSNTAYVRSEQGNVLAGMAYSSSFPYVVANHSGAMAVETNSSGKATTAYGMGYVPGELATVMMGYPLAFSGLQVTPANGGIYDVGLSVRDMQYGDPGDSRKGVNVWLLQGGVVLAKTYVSVEGSHSSDVVFIKDLVVFPQIPLTVAVDNNGVNSSDGTGIIWAFIRKGGFSATYDANAAMKANMKSSSPVNPFTHSGAAWTAGICAGGWKGAFNAYGTRQDRFSSTLKGFGENSSSSPYMLVNVAERALTASEISTTLGAGVDMLLGHPKSDESATALRFTAPADGVYSATAWFAHLNSSGTGVDVHLMAEGRHVDSALVQLQLRYTGMEANRLCADRLFMRTGETLTFAIGSYGTHNYDMTGFYAWVDPESDAASLQGINVDFNCKGAGTTYAGAGRVGYAGERWNGLAVENGAAGYASCPLHVASGARTGATLSLAKTGGSLSASAAGTATDTSASALFEDGVVSADITDVNAFTLAGLLPNTKYELYFFSRALADEPPATAASVVRGMFTVGDVAAASERTWFADEFGDYARIDATSDETGIITGTFRSASADAAAFWCGLQVLGPGFSAYASSGFIMIIR